MSNVSQQWSDNVSLSLEPRGTHTGDGSSRSSRNQNSSSDPFLRETPGPPTAVTDPCAASAQDTYQSVDPFILGLLEDYEVLLQSAPRAVAEYDAVWLHRASPTSTGEGSSGRGALVRSAVTRLWSTFCKKWHMAQARRELYELDDHTLKDIGIHRSQIESVVRHGRLYGR